ncbi:MAG: lipase family protein [Alsobacter sp.]
MSFRSFASAAVLAVASVLPSAQAAEVAVPAFYAAASQLAPQGKLGAVLARQPVATSIPGAQAWRIAYVSSDHRGQPTISTGLVVAPKGKPPAGGRPIVAWAHGTTGAAQNCGPSQVEDPAQPLNEYFLIGGTSWTDFGIPAVNQFIKAGYVVVATDYQGLGGGGRSQYMVTSTQAHDTIDSIRAAGSLGLAGANRKAAIYGWSQGAGVTLTAASSPGYVARTGTAFDGVELVGFVAMAPPDVAVLAPKGPLDDAAAQKVLAGMTASFSDSVFNFTHYALTIWATAYAYPQLKLTDIFTDDGARAIDEIISKKCMHAAADTMNYTYGAGFKSLLRDTPRNPQAWVASLIDGAVPDVKPSAPVVIYFGTRDTAIAPVMGQLYREQMCKAGANVSRVQLAGEQTHFSTPGISEPLYLPWLMDRFAGKPAADGCAGG